MTKLDRANVYGNHDSSLPAPRKRILLLTKMAPHTNGNSRILVKHNLFFANREILKKMDTAVTTSEHQRLDAPCELSKTCTANQRR